MGYIAKLALLFALIIATCRAQTENATLTFGNIVSTVKSSRYPNNYLPKEYRTWNVSSDSGRPMEIIFLDFRIEDTGNCGCDKLTLREGSTGEIIYEGCGYKVPPMMTSKTGQVTVTFKSDGSVQDRGFHIIFRDSGLVSTEGIIKSSNYPGDYNPNENTTWFISTPPGYGVEIEFIELGIESATSCNFDKLVIREDLSLKIIYEGCGNITPPNLVSESSKLSVIFTSDGSVQGRGFHLRWKAVSIQANITTIPSDIADSSEKDETTNPNEMTDIKIETQTFSIETTTFPSFTKATPLSTRADKIPSPLGDLTAVVLSFHYPSNYPSYEHSIYTVTSRSGQGLEIMFLDFDIEGKHAGEVECVRDKLTLREGSGELIFEGCGKQLPPKMTSRTNKVITTFVSDERIEKKGFYILFRDTNYSQNAGSVKSLNYPANYRSNERQTWTISAPLGHNVEIDFVEINIEYDELCTYDKLVIQELPSQKVIFEGCGYDTPPKLVSEGNLLLVTFTSNHINERKGFYFNWKAIPKVENVTTELTTDETSLPTPSSTTIPVISEPRDPNSYAFPRHVIIQKGRRLCHGFNISPKVILTASSCLMEIQGSPFTITITTPSPRNITAEAIFVVLNQPHVGFVALSNPVEMNMNEMNIVDLPESGEEFSAGIAANPWDSRVGSGLFCNRKESTKWILCGIRNEEGSYDKIYESDLI